MNDYCPVCQSTLKIKQDLSEGRDGFKFSCPLCGDFIMSRTLVEDLPYTLKTNKDATAKISHAIRQMQRANKLPVLSENTIDEIIKTQLPNPMEQTDLFIRWLAENSDGPGEGLWVEPDTHKSIIGAKTSNGFALILQHLFNVGLVTGNLFEATDTPSKACSYVTLSMAGWECYEKLQQGAGSYRKAFMAMKFNVPELDTMVNNVFKTAIMQTGFELRLISDTPKAGLIDDRIRAEIQASDFIVADLTHDNLGAYWEAGYAEGLGKPGIYTCEKTKFDNEKTHFDTNHHLTIIWSSNNPDQASEDLKATVRATLPHIAKQDD